MNKQEIKGALQWINGIINNFGFEQRRPTVDEAYAVKEALTQQLNNGWIPVSERLPEETGYYDVTNKAGRLEHLWFKSTEKRWYFFHSDIEHLNVVAWQSLPEPYKEVSE